MATGAARRAAPILEVRNLTKRFPGVVALDDVSVAFEAGKVHAVVGENGAGKSTLMHILGGDLKPDGGEIRLDGRPLHLATPLDAQSLGITVVYQELALCQNLSVAENVMMPATADRLGASRLPRRQMGREASAILARLGMTHLDPETPVRRLSVAEMQMVEIARALSRNARILVLDEPNSALSPRESDRLFQVVRQLRGEGVAILYVSHYLDEVLGLADTITVLRDGTLRETIPASEADEPRLIRAMVGRDLAGATPLALEPFAAKVKDAPPVLDVIDLAAPAGIDGLSFTLRQGEILGIGGLPDSGKDVLGDVLMGLLPRQGEVRVDGQPVAPTSAAALRAGLAYIPADRRAAGAFGKMSVASNVVASTLPRFSTAGFVRRKRVEKEARAQVARLDARISSLHQTIATLSGGNQQKIILSRGLVANPRVLILHEPTRGIDVGAKEEIYSILRKIADEGVGVLMITSEMTELVLHATRVLIMCAGRLAGDLSGDTITEEAIMERASP